MLEFAAQATATVTSDQTTISALQTAYSQNVAAFETIVKDDATLKGYGYVSLPQANTGSSFSASSIAAAACMVFLA